MAHATALLLCAVMNALSDEPLHSADRCSHAAALANSPAALSPASPEQSSLRLSLQALRCGAERNATVCRKTAVRSCPCGTLDSSKLTLGR